MKISSAVLKLQHLQGKGDTNRSIFTTFHCNAGAQNKVHLRSSFIIFVEIPYDAWGTWTNADIGIPETTLIPRENLYVTKIICLCTILLLFLIWDTSVHEFGVSAVIYEGIILAGMRGCTKPESSEVPLTLWKGQNCNSLVRPNGDASLWFPLFAGGY
jgi:hypothetical protein